jgi:hypothetical protein
VAYALSKKFDFNAAFDQTPIQISVTSDSQTALIALYDKKHLPSQPVLKLLGTKILAASSDYYARRWLR